MAQNATKIYANAFYLVKGQSPGHGIPGRYRARSAADRVFAIGAGAAEKYAMTTGASGAASWTWKFARAVAGIAAARSASACRACSRTRERAKASRRWSFSSTSMALIAVASGGAKASEPPPCSGISCAACSVAPARTIPRFAPRSWASTSTSSRARRATPRPFAI